ncbi:ABC transporter permease [Actinosynnema sp. CA-299493]
MLVLTSRSVRVYLGDPRLVVLGVLQPLLVFLVFSQLFGGMLQSSARFPPGVSYLDYLLPAIMMTTGIGSALQSGVGLVEDLANGIVVRLRSMPVRPVAVLLARSAGDLMNLTGQLFLLLALALVISAGVPAGGLAGLLGAFLMTMAIGWSLGWVFLAIATWLRNASAMQSIGMMAMFPLMFASSAYVPLAGLPDWLRLVALVNPLTHGVDAIRGLVLGTSVGHSVWFALAAGACVCLVSVRIAVRGFTRAR